jgi:hypothetical protein
METQMIRILLAAAVAVAMAPVSLIVTTRPANACTLHGYKGGYCSLAKYIQDNPAEAKSLGYTSDSAGQKKVDKKK